MKKWEREITEASIDPEFISKVESIGFSVDYSDHESFKRRVLEEAKTWQELVKKLGLATE